MAGCGKTLNQDKILILGLMPKNADPATYIAAGPWCFCEQEKDFPDWEKNFTFAPEPLHDHKERLLAVRASQTLAVKLIKPVSNWIYNAENLRASQLPDEYWQALLLPWLIKFSSQLIERSLRVKAMLDKWRDEYFTIPILPQNYVFEFLNEEEFILRGVLNINYNWWLFSRILEYFKADAWKLVESKPENEARIMPMRPDLRKNLVNVARQILLKLPFPKLKGMSLAQAFQLSKALGHSRHSKTDSIDIKSHFSYFEDLNSLIPESWDISALWKASLPQSVRNLSHRPIKPSRKMRLRVVAISASDNIIYRQKIARWRGAGNRLAYAQHGANYGQVQIPCDAELIEYSQTAFFTWGWKAQGLATGNFIPLPSLWLERVKSLSRLPDNDTLIYVGTEMPMFCHRLDSHPSPLQYLQYREDKAQFFKTLPTSIIEHSLYRPYFNLPGTYEDGEWLLPQFPKLKICAGNLMAKMTACRIMVVDHHGTSLLEALAANIPVVTFWDQECWPVCPEFKLLMAILEKARIWHPTPLQAARHVMVVWDHVDEWWNATETVSAKKEFCRFQADTSPHAIKDWIQKLKTL